MTARALPEAALAGKCWLPTVSPPSRSRLLTTLALGLCALGALGWSSPASAGEPHPRRRAEAGEPARDRDEGDRGPTSADKAPASGVPQPSGGRRSRRGLEGVAGARSDDELSRSDAMEKIEWREGGCAIEGHRGFVKALLATENKSDLMSLEVWGDAHEYVPYQRVYYYLRVPRPAYVTLFWIGPDGDVFVPFQNLKIPANRDVSVDPDSIVVPPLGREQWVALATLEAAPLPCFDSDKGQVAWLNRLKKLPLGVGRWEVRSKR